MSLFQKTVTEKYLKTQNPEILLQKWNVFIEHFHDLTKQENIRNLKEEQYQGEFLIDLFVNVLGYTKSPNPNFNLTTEYKNIKDSKKADGAIIINDSVKGIIELKGTNTTDLSKIESQAFGYKNNQEGCKYVITSNFEKLRFYIDNAIEHLEFNLFTLTRDEFNILYLCLGYENVAADIPEKIKKESVSQEDTITKKLYKDYSIFKRELFQSLVAQNPEFDQLELFKKSQKLLDRLLFLLFGEDRGLLPPNSVRLILQQWDKLKDLDEYVPLYDRFKKYFGYLNTGFSGKQFDVFAYNGGLFKPDEILDQIKIDDTLLYTHTHKLSEYDFDSEVDVNILGHIFENSLNEIDEIKAQLEGQEIDKSKTKRKKDGVFYTPKYITKYIVENTVGKLCAEKKQELGIVEEDYFTDKKRQQKTKELLLRKLKDYREWLLEMTIIDPACGSGAFINEALNFLIAEHKYIDELETKLLGGGFVFPNIENSILENNLFGVDLNEESVEIAKLSLWLRTAQPNRKLNDLSNNIKCGNSLIDDPEIAGDKAFNWEKEFPQVFAKGGFDVVIGNPPYGAKVSDNEKYFLTGKYSFINPKTNDTYLFFTFKMIELLKNKGFLGEIIPNTWMLINTAEEVRKEILKYNLIEVIDYGDGVFDDATVESSTIILKKTYDSLYEISTIRKKGNFVIKNNIINKNDWLSNSGTKILIDLDVKSKLIFDKCKINSQDFNYVAEIIWGIKPYQVGHGVPEQTKEMLTNRIYHSDVQIDTNWKPLVVGSNINRYYFNKSKIDYILYGKNLMYQSSFERINSPKILLRQTSDTLRCSIDYENFYPQNSLFIISLVKQNLKLEYLCLLLNSKLINFLYKILNPQTGKTFAEIKPSAVKLLPIKNISLSEQQPFIEKANQMLSLNKELQELSDKFQRTLKRKFSLEDLSKKLQDWYNISFADFIKELGKQKVKLSLTEEAEWEDYFITEQQKAQSIKNTITQTDKEIDQMVYELYGLTNEEIEIVEKG
ncbi:Eco57I restriction-modification methylase domain-containing protein [Cloacibacterium normanense]|uniref:Eco57I restriction-modification methylase domain-containing protein n=1 Tax=Cloacibacterium normanense TaxID=237258 RepID=UPI0035B43190